MMTAFADGLKKAGVNTAAAELYTACVDALKKAGSPKQARKGLVRALLTRRHLLDELADEKLQRVHADMTGQPMGDTQALRAGQGGAGQNPGETQAESTRPASHSKKTVPVVAHKRRTPQEKAAAHAMEMVSAAAIFSSRRIDGTLIGNLPWGRLRALVHDNATNAASYLRQGTEATENAILLDLIEQHCSVDDHRRLVRDVISSKQLEEFEASARILAPKLVEEGMRLYAHTVEQRRIADAQA